MLDSKTTIAYLDRVNYDIPEIWQSRPLRIASLPLQHAWRAHVPGNLETVPGKSQTFIRFYKGVSKNRGTPKWMVYNGKPY